MIQVHNRNNMDFQSVYWLDLVFADCIYESLSFDWIDNYWEQLNDNGVMIVMTDYHSVAQMKIHMDGLYMSNFINWAIYKMEWGGVPRKGFPQKHDDILIYSKGDDFKWRGDRIQIPKKTAGTAFDKKGTGLKTPCSVFDDLGNFSTMAKERIKDRTGRNIRWQKPLKLIERLLLPFTDEGDIILDPFLGSGTTALWCAKNKRNCIGIEKNTGTFNIACDRLERENVIFEAR